MEILWPRRPRSIRISKAGAKLRLWSWRKTHRREACTQEDNLIAWILMVASICNILPSINSSSRWWIKPNWAKVWWKSRKIDPSRSKTWRNWSNKDLLTCTHRPNLRSILRMLQAHLFEKKLPSSNASWRWALYTRPRVMPPRNQEKRHLPSI